MLWTCSACTARYAVGLEKCPQCAQPSNTEPAPMPRKPRKPRPEPKGDR